ncbi:MULTISPECIES: DNA primase [Streptomyces]|uniref:DNA primase n=1 Tax=Streptomyces TaxID=1883 RepID=UPI00287F7466|nr:DNA primase [Streptomyces sp. CGMCC 4.1456]WNF66141.1 DNA primase [Streptomyces sp. CGMCC 4.1456]
MNRMGLGLAVGAGYLLGRTKKLKMAAAVGGLVAGKKLNLSPRMVADLVQQQLRNNPQFKEIGDQLREDLRGVGKAASGAMVERQIDALADRLHGRTAQMRDQLTGAVPGGRDDDAEDAEYEDEDEEPEDEEPEADEPEDSGPDEDEGEEPAAKKAPAKKAPAKKTAKKAPAKKAPAKKTAGRKAAAKKTTPARKATSGGRGGSARSRLPKGGGEG